MDRGTKVWVCRGVYFGAATVINWYCGGVELLAEVSTEEGERTIFYPWSEISSLERISNERL